MRVLLTTYDSRGGVEPLLGLAVQLRALGAEVLVCVPPDEEFAERAAAFDVPLVPFGESVRATVTRATPPSEEELRRQLDDLIAAQFDTVAAAAEGCDALVATNMVATAAGARSATEQLGIHYVYGCYHPCHLPSPYHLPLAYLGWPFGDIEGLWDLDAQNVNAAFGETLNRHRASLGLPPVDSVRDHALTDRPWLATDPILGPWPGPHGSTDLGVVQTGAWFLADERPLPADVEAFLDAGTPPVYLGFGSMALRGPTDLARLVVEAILAQGRRAIVSRGWADLAVVSGREDCFAVGEINQQALFRRVAAVVHHGGAGTTTTAAQAGAPQVVIPQGADQVYWAHRVAQLGIGAAHVGMTPTIDTLSAALATTVAPDTRARASEVAGTIRTDGAMVAAKLLVDAITGEAQTPESAPPRGQ